MAALAVGLLILLGGLQPHAAVDRELVYETEIERAERDRGRAREERGGAWAAWAVLSKECVNLREFALCNSRHPGLWLDAHCATALVCASPSRVPAASTRFPG